MSVLVEKQGSGYITTLCLILFFPSHPDDINPCDSSERCPSHKAEVKQTLFSLSSFESAAAVCICACVCVCFSLKYKA